MTKRITIGRNEANDWRVPESYNTISNYHADLEETANGHLHFIDHSRNGTVVNGIRLRNTSVDIKEGDEIRLANSYTLSWEQIFYYFPRRKETVNVNNEGLTGRGTELHNTPREFMQNPMKSDLEAELNYNSEIDRAK